MSRPTLSIPTSEDRVLLAMEDDVSADLLTHRMTRRGIHPERAEHGQDAIREIQKTPFDLVIIETQFPGLTGLELLQHSPSDQIAGSPQIIVLGEGGKNEEIIRAFELGAVEYIERPFAPEVALARIVRFLGEGRHLVSRPASSLLFGISSFGSVLDLGVFDLMVGVTGIMVVLALAIAAFAGYTHVRAKKRERRRRSVRTRWKRLLLEILAGDKSPDHLIYNVTESQERFFLEFLEPYAVTFEGRAQELLIDLARPFMIRLEEDLGNGDPGQRARALRLFGLLGDVSCRSILRNHLADPSRIVAYTAFQWLARRGTEDDAAYLLNELDRLSDADVNKLSSALLDLGPDAALTFRTYLKDGAQSPFVRVVCAETLRWMSDGKAGPLSAQLLVYEPPPELAAALLRLLRRVGHPDHAPLVRSYCADDVPFVRIHAARALGQIGHPEDDRKLLRDLVLDSTSRWAALNAARSLKELGQTTPLHYLSRTNHAHASLADNVLKEPVS